jgi:hypothetical protein
MAPQFHQHVSKPVQQTRVAWRGVESVALPIISRYYRCLHAHLIPPTRAVAQRG